MTLDQLRYFKAVCQHDNVSLAAEALNISQPSVSNAIANLEKEFGSALFTRQRKRLVLTKEGTLLLEMTEQLLSQADNINRIMREMGSKKQILRLGVPPMIGSLALPVLFTQHFNRYPQLQVHIAEDSNSGLKRLLADNQIDMAFLPHIHSFGSEWCSVPVTELQNVCCVSKTHRLAGRSKICLADLKDEPLVLFKNSFFQTQRILEGFSHISCTPNVLLDTAQLSTVQNVVASNAVVGFMFEFLLKSTPSLVGIPLDPPMSTLVSLVWKKDRHVSESMENLIQFIKETPNGICTASQG
ncbi:MAG: LysR family transcriptional regulator [Oscillospiraceae bacterium]|nr:LysR family transcriptional regulator [Oscillospiraceae bacterium]